jgi:hypothetical protein
MRPLIPKTLNLKLNPPLKEFNGKETLLRTVEEDNVLVSAWLTISMDPIGTDQKGSTFWGRVRPHYKKYKKPNCCVRSVNSLMNRWQMILKAINKFNAKVVQIEAKRPSTVLPN